MKKILALLLALILAMTMLAGCGDTIDDDTDVTQPNDTNTDVTEPNSDDNANAPVSGDHPAEWNGYDISFVYDNGIEYIWNQLEEEVKTDFADMMTAIANVTPFCTLTYGIPRDELKPFLELVCNCAIDYTYVDTSFRPHDTNEDNIIDALTINFNFNAIQTEQDAWNLTETLNRRIDEIVAGMPNGTEYERIKYLHDYLVFNCTYSEDSMLPFTAYGALVEGMATCQGYADAMHLLLDRAGFETCFCIGVGNNDAVTHKWNYVKLSDGQWYILDPTWADPAGKDDPNYICYDYFLISDEEILKDHHAKNESSFYETPVATSMEMNYHKTEGYYFTNYDDAKSSALEQIRACAADGRKYLYFRFDSVELFTQVRQQLLSRDYGAEIQDLIKTVADETGVDYNSGRWAVYGGYDADEGKGPLTIIVTLRYNSDP